MQLTEKHQAFHDAIMVCSGIELQLAELEKRRKELEAELVQAESDRDAKASDAAQEKLEAGFAAIEMPDGTFRLVQKARRGKKTEANPGGTEPKHPFVVLEKVLRT